VNGLFQRIKDWFLGKKDSGKFGTFGGVFTPDVLTILGVIMYLRLGWVVGNAGLLGAVAIILMAKVITICTGLSMSSIITNIKIGAGGAYSIISKSLGLEAGGSIGIPFYVSQTLSAALYIVGFTEGWLTIFPGHNPLIVSIAIWLILMTISYLSTAFALKTQYIVMVVIAVSILSFLLSPNSPNENIVLVGNFEDAGFWFVFAVFFPAVTGIMAGANLSGDLKNPRRAIPIGTMSAIGVTLIIYVGLAYAASVYISPEELRTNQMAMVDNALFGFLVLMGILAATFSSALGSIIGAPRLLQALAEQKTVPFSNIFVKKSKNNEPQNAIIFTGIIIFVALLLGNLNALASLITMFFLITYGMINLVVFIQQSMGIISFRPAFKIPRFVSFIGAFGCLFIMLLINPVFTVIAVLIIIYLYVWLTKKELKTQSGDIRGGMFMMLAEVSTKIASKFPRHSISWKPDILLPIEDPKVWAGPMLFIRNVLYPSGSLYAFTVKNEDTRETKDSLEKLIAPLKGQNLLATTAVLEDEDFLKGAKLAIQALEGSTFNPNILFLTLGSKPEKDEILNKLINEATRFQMGIVILRQHQRMAFGMQKQINIWLRDQSTNWNLAVLIMLQLQLNWNCNINLITVADNEEDKSRLYKFLNNLSQQTRLPSQTEFHVLAGKFEEALRKAPRSDINIFGIGEKFEFNFMRNITELSNSSCLFVKDSGSESAIA
jgi:amino acid transporter